MRWKTLPKIYKISLEDCIEEFLTYLECVKSLSENTVKAYRNNLEFLKTCICVDEDTVFIDDLTIFDLRTCVAILSEMRFSISKKNQFISSIRSLFSYAKKFEYINFNCSKELTTFRGQTKLPSFLTHSEMRDFIENSQQQNILWQERDCALFHMLYSSGCRVSEVANLTFSGMNFDYASAIVTGKGNKERRVFFSKEAVKFFNQYLASRKSRFNVKEFSGKDFVFINQKGFNLTSRGIGFIIAKYSQSVSIKDGFTNTNVHPHTFRHSFATTLLHNDADIRIVQSLLGHSSVSTTQRYTHITKEEKIEKYRKAHPHGEK